MNKVDEFFKKKIDGLAIAPRPEAWSKLESTLSKKNNGFIWQRLAAAVLLVGLSLMSIMWLNQSATINPVAKQETKNSNSATQEKTSIRKDSVTTPKEVNKITKSNVYQHRVKQATVSQQPPIEIKEEKEPEATLLETIQSETSHSETVVAESVSVEKPIVIEYTLESISYLKKEKTIVVETVEKKTSLQKAIDFAREAKNSDSPMANLRQAKDDLFAMNFKKDKHKKQ